MTLRSIVKHSFAYSVSVVLSKVASVLLTPIYTRYLSPADYGVIELLDLTTFAVSLLAGYYLADAFLYQYSNAPEADRERVLSTAFFGAMGVGLAVFLGIWVSAPLVSELVFGTNRYAFYFQL